MIDKLALEQMTRTDLIDFIETLNLRMEELQISMLNYQHQLDRIIEKDEVYRTLLDESSDPIFMFYPDGTYRYVNHAFAEGVGRPQDKIIGNKISDVFPPEEAEKRFSVMRWVFQNGQTRIFDVRVPRPDGDRYYITTVKPVFDEQGGVVSVICISKEITDRKRMEQELLRLSTFDALTGLYNRHYFHLEMERVANDMLFPACFVMIDLDNLKVINDRKGHKAGDSYLEKAANLLKSCFRSQDIISRIGGDEFVVLLPETTEETLLPLLASLREGIRNLGDPLFNMSIGWARGDRDSRLEDIMHQADVRMYREKILHRK